MEITGIFHRVRNQLRNKLKYIEKHFNANTLLIQNSLKNQFYDLVSLLSPIIKIRGFPCLLLSAQNTEK